MGPLAKRSADRSMAACFYRFMLVKFFKLLSRNIELVLYYVSDFRLDMVISKNSYMSLPRPVLCATHCPTQYGTIFVRTMPLVSAVAYLTGSTQTLPMWLLGHTCLIDLLGM